MVKNRFLLLAAGPKPAAIAQQSPGATLNASWLHILDGLREDGEFENAQRRAAPPDRQV